MTEYRVLGPPGTGKTTYLGRQIESAVDAGLSVSVASLTRAAAAEIVSRDLPVDDRAIGTLHSHAYHSLGRPTIADSPKMLKRWNEDIGDPRLKVSGGRDIDDDNLDARHSVSAGDDAYNQMTLYRARRTPMELWKHHVRAFHTAWSAWKRENELLDFTDLIEMCLDFRPAAPGDPDVLFLDEAQDMSRLEMALARKWGDAAGRLVIAGDPRQAIYTWRGADPAIFYDDSVPDSHTRVLSQSYRVSQAVHTRAERWIGRSQIIPPVEYRARDEAGYMAAVSATWKYPEPLIPEIEEDIAVGLNVMVLASCAYMLRPIITLLRKSAIPFHNPHRRSNGAWNPLRTGGKRVSASQRLLAFLDYSENQTWRKSQLTRWTDSVRVAGTFQKGGKERLKNMADLLTEREAFQVLDQPARVAAAMADVEWFRSQLLAQYRRGMELPAAIWRKRGADALRAHPLVTVGTCHSVKGGEADVVYLFPDLSPQGVAEWVGNAEQKASVFRLMYVGMTRARHTLRLCSPATRMAVDF